MWYLIPHLQIHCRKDYNRSNSLLAKWTTLIYLLLVLTLVASSIRLITPVWGIKPSPKPFLIRYSKVLSGNFLVYLTVTPSSRSFSCISFTMALLSALSDDTIETFIHWNSCNTAINDSILCPDVGNVLANVLYKDLSLTDGSAQPYGKDKKEADMVRIWRQKKKFFVNLNRGGW